LFLVGVLVSSILIIGVGVIGIVSRWLRNDLPLRS
jgi:hypothetical protein